MGGSDPENPGLIGAPSRGEFMMPKSNRHAGFVVAAAAMLPAIFLVISSHAVSATELAVPGTPIMLSQATTAQTQAAKPSPAATAKAASASVDRVEARIKDLHKKLQVTGDQEALWTDLAQVMRANAKKMSDLIADRSAKLKTLNAVDDLRSYQMITDEHADGLKRLIPSFAALYAKMTPAQQKNADHIFSEQQRQAARRS